MKITAITDHAGELVAIVHAHLSEHHAEAAEPGQPRATILRHPDHRHHELTAPADLAKATPDELRHWTLTTLKSHRERA